jgi:hypothetical protein
VVYLIATLLVGPSLRFHCFFTSERIGSITLGCSKRVSVPLISLYPDCLCEILQSSARFKKKEMFESWTGVLCQSRRRSNLLIVFRTRGFSRTGILIPACTGLRRSLQECFSLQNGLPYDKASSPRAWHLVFKALSDLNPGLSQTNQTPYALPAACGRADQAAAPAGSHRRCPRSARQR